MSTTPIVGVRYALDATGKLWVASGRPSLPAVDTALDRALLVAGEYEPSDATTGPLPGWDQPYTQVEGDASGRVLLTTANKTYDRYEFWGAVSFRAPGIKVTNSIFHAGAPGTSSGNSCVVNYNDNDYHAVIENSLFDPYAWFTERGYLMMTAATYIARSGVHGGDVELRWCRIKNVTDGVNFVQSDNTLGGDPGNRGFNNGRGWVVPAGDRFMVVDRCFIDSSAFTNGPDYVGQSGGYPHCDGFQFNIGRNVWIVGSKIGNTRVPSVYKTWGVNPSNPPISPDNGTSAFMVQQETPASGPPQPGTPQWLTNILIERNFAGGGAATFNLILKNGNTLSGFTIRDNKVLQRQAEWGMHMADGVMVSDRGGYGMYIAGSPSQLAITWQNNTVAETGAVIPYAYG